MLLASELQADLPAIFRGLLNLIADIFPHLPDAEVTNPERMFDFVHWLAAMEKAQGTPTGVYQAAYSNNLRQVQLDSLLDNTLAAAVYQFAENHIDDEWTGTPADLLSELNSLVTIGTQRSRDWPHNAISLSKRLKPLQAGLLSQGIRVESGRGKLRSITITKLEDLNDE